jgi:hypothetical protein
MSMLEEEKVGEQIHKRCLTRKCSALSGYIRESNLRINLERQNRKLAEQNSIYKKAIDSLIAMVGELLSPHYPVTNFLREHLQDIPRVTKAYSFITDNVINLWIITEEEDFEAEMEIADTLRELFSVFRNLSFDFMIIPRYDMNMEEAVPKDSQVIFSRP